MITYRIDEQTWGARLNEQLIFTSQKLRSPEGCPSWAKGSQINDYRKIGLAIWDHTTERLELLCAATALEMLNMLCTTSEWRTAGIAITQRVVQIKLDDTAVKPRRSRKGKKADALL
ncbi:MAG TPA: hypothetical protein VGK81_02465, partial [Anaerolineae bacterium]